MSRHVSAHAANTSGIAPDHLYTRDGFVRASGIAKTRIREARLQGIEPNWLKVGKRYYIRGADGITFIEKLAALSESSR